MSSIGPAILIQHKMTKKQDIVKDQEGQELSSADQEMLSYSWLGHIYKPNVLTRNCQEKMLCGQWSPQWMCKLKEPAIRRVGKARTVKPQ